MDLGDLSRPVTQLATTIDLRTNRTHLPPFSREGEASKMAISNEKILALVRGLPLPVPWQRDVFVDNLAERRGRAIKLIPIDTAALGFNPCGLWVARDEDDLILHEIGTSDYHIDQIVGHEIGHMLLEHSQISIFGADKARERDLCRRFLPDVDPDTVSAVLGRTDGAHDEEQEAEMFASLLMIAATEANERSQMMRSAFFRRR